MNSLRRFLVWLGSVRVTDFQKFRRLCKDGKCVFVIGELGEKRWSNSLFSSVHPLYHFQCRVVLRAYLHNGGLASFEWESKEALDDSFSKAIAHIGKQMSASDRMRHQSLGVLKEIISVLREDGIEVRNLNESTCELDEELVALCRS